MLHKHICTYALQDGEWKRTHVPYLAVCHGRDMHCLLAYAYTWAHARSLGERLTAHKGAQCPVHLGIPLTNQSADSGA